jgi:hypothetical protein
MNFAQTEFQKVSRAPALPVAKEGRIASPSRCGDRPGARHDSNAGACVSTLRAPRPLLASEAQDPAREKSPI